MGRDSLEARRIAHVTLYAMRIAALLLTLAVSAFPQAEYFPPQNPPSNLPNIVLITGDHMRWDHIAANGNPAMITPFMDELANTGSTFRSCFTVGVACTPNRASLMTGRYPSSHGLISNGIMMPEDEVTLTHVLRDAGYYTGQMGKLHFMPHKDRDHREPYKPYGFHQMRLSDEPGCYDDAYGRWLWAKGKEQREHGRVNMPGDRPSLEHYTFEGTGDITHASWAATETITFIQDTRRRYPDRPFFVHTGFYAPHPPLNPPASALAKYEGRKLPPRYYGQGELDTLPPLFAKGMVSLLETPADTWDSYRRHFYAMVTHLDENVGRIMDSVKKAGAWDNTIWVITSDHGDYLGNHNITSKSDRPYDGAMRIPLIFRGPGVPAGKKNDELVEIMDVMPTLLDMLGMENTKGNQGVSLEPVMNGAPGRDFIYMQGMQNKTVRSKSAMYSIYRNGEELLFDLEKDPHQLRNIAQDASAKALLDQMRVTLLKKTIDARDPLPERIRPY